MWIDKLFKEILWAFDRSADCYDQLLDKVVVLGRQAIRSGAKVLELLHIMIGPNGCPHELKFTDEYYTDIEVLKRTIKSMAIDMTIDQVDDYLFILKMTRKSQ